jgi:hypothetical protein
MKRLVSAHDVKRLFGWIGTISLVLIIPVKAMRWMDESLALKILTDIAPSVLGPAGLLFLMLSSSGRLARFSLLQTTYWIVIAQDRLPSSSQGIGKLSTPDWQCVSKHIGILPHM